MRHIINNCSLSPQSHGLIDAFTALLGCKCELQVEGDKCLELFICAAVRSLLSSDETAESSAPCPSTDHLKSHEPRQGSPKTAS